MGIEEDVEGLKCDLENVVKEAMNCKLDVYTKITEFEQSLDSASIDRANYNSMLNNKIDKIADVQADLVKSHIDLQEWFVKHDEKEMEKYENHTDAINNLNETLVALSEKTLKHSSFIQSTIHNEEMEQAVADKMYELEAPARKRKEIIYNTALALITTGVIYGVYYTATFIYNLSLEQKKSEKVKHG